MPVTSPAVEARAFLPVARMIAGLSDTRAVQRFADVFFTEKEKEMLAERLAIFQLLAEGHTQREIAAQLGCSVVTVTRGAKAYRENRAAIDRWLGLPATARGATRRTV